ncbi:alanine--tRNA ligase [Archaeoglobus profundus]|uniref:Alanine--tRNA ligase n=1 Tax=Archaeoglobus profundus (strain DSM 5631 / JCM 9629 / NBRC 100127 / Av18) TaxID=572546 RepID=D2RFS9_ARCPA|nr:alanine--tRNA ligase [Archaeoglobus profundus]ADB57154.1 alanyl-tRNA synthetase [Archaeoglobus profundus DSM 5631]
MPNALEKEYLDITFLKENGFIRKKCPKCGKYFWTVDESREICGDPPCDSYKFIGNPIFKKEFDLKEMREYYLRFFEERGHTRIDRYPVVARWRDDIYLTIASIADFQPFVTSGVAPPPANPLTISQPCIRMDDLDSIGKTGRHLSLFEMMAHHAFNYPNQHIYWKNETVQYCTELLQSLGVKLEDIVYKEEPWAGGGNAGPCLEAIVGGIELATLVFMNLVEDPNGDIVVKGSRYRKMENYIVDTGYGLERFVWASKGTPTVYDAVFPEVVEFILKNSDVEKPDERIVAESSKLAGIMGELSGEKLLEFRKNLSNRLGVSLEELERVLIPMEMVYALADHTRAILFMLGDGLVPSNAGAGYLARLMIRRSLRLAEEIGFSLSIFDLVELHRKILKEFEFEVPLETIQEMLEIEEKKYKLTIQRGISLVERKILRKGRVDKEDLIEFYDSHGIPPEIVVRIAKERGVEVEMPKDFYAELASRHMKAEKKVEEKKLKGSYPKTEKLYYDNPKLFEFTAKVIGVEGDKVILDRTAFYPESGGQASDTGYFEVDGKRIKVLDVQEEDGVVYHVVEGELKVGDVVRGVIDADRRLRHMRHHSATHLLLYSLRKLYGNHVWQAGARKERGKARLDVTHYKKPSDEEIAEIEKLVNAEIMANKPVTWEWMDRIEAERRYGFRLYQGGVPPGRVIRVVRVGDDVQACGGTHCNSTGEIGFFKIVRVESIQDGVIRFEFTAGESALEYVQEIERILKDASTILRVEPSKLPKTVERFFEEWKERGKKIERLKREIAKVKAEKLLENAEEFDSIKVVCDVMDASMDEMVKIAEELVKAKAVGVLMNTEGKVKVVTFSGIDVDARELMKEIGKRIKGGGGGRKEIAQGAGQIALNKDELMTIVFEFLSRNLKA